MTTQIAPRRTSRDELTAFPAFSSLPAFPFRMGGLPNMIDRMRNEFDRMLNRYDIAWPTAWEENGAAWGMTVSDDDDAVVVRCETPGFAASDFDLRFSDNRLTLRATHKVEQKQAGMVASQDRQYCESVLLPEGIDREKIDATYQNGVLTVKLPKTPEGKSKKIAIKSI